MIPNKCDKIIVEDLALIDVKQISFDRRNFVYRSYNPTPSSLRRVCRLLQGQPAFGEPEQVCKWRKNPSGSYYSTCERIYYPAPWQNISKCYDYCPYCGRKVKVVE